MRSRSKETRRRNLRLLSQKNGVVQAKVREAKAGKRELQRGNPLVARLKALPRECDRGSSRNAQGYKNSWNGDKRHIDTTDYGVPVSALHCVQLFFRTLY